MTVPHRSPDRHRRGPGGRGQPDGGRADDVHHERLSLGAARRAGAAHPLRDAAARRLPRRRRRPSGRTWHAAGRTAGHRHPGSKRPGRRRRQGPLHERAHPGRPGSARHRPGRQEGARRRPSRRRGVPRGQPQRDDHHRRPGPGRRRAAQQRDHPDPGQPPDPRPAAGRGGRAPGRCGRVRARTPPAQAAARGGGDRPRGVRPAAGHRRHQPDRPACPPTSPTSAPRWARWAPPSTRCWRTSRPRWSSGTAASSRCASSSPTPPTSCGHRWPPSPATPSSRGDAPTTRRCRRPRWPRSRRRASG